MRNDDGERKWKKETGENDDKEQRKMRNEDGRRERRKQVKIMIMNREEWEVKMEKKRKRK